MHCYLKNFMNPDQLGRLWKAISTDPKKMLLRLLAVLFVLWLLFDDYGIVKRIGMEIEHRELVERQEAFRTRMQYNDMRIKNASAPDTIEKAAREKYNFRKPNEVLFIIREK